MQKYDNDFNACINIAYRIMDPMVWEAKPSQTSNTTKDIKTKANNRSPIQVRGDPRGVVD